MSEYLVVYTRTANWAAERLSIQIYIFKLFGIFSFIEANNLNEKQIG